MTAAQGQGSARDSPALADVSEITHHPRTPTGEPINSPLLAGSPPVELVDQRDRTGLIGADLADVAAPEGRAKPADPAPDRSEAGPAESGTAAGDLTDANREVADDPPTERTAPTVWEQMGGPMGMLDSGLPVVVFVVANVIGGLGWGIGAALAAALVIAILRISRKRPITQAVTGLFGVGIAAFIAYKTGSAKGYFLLGIWSYLLYGGVLLLSILVRWPLIGVIWEGINGKGTAWRSSKKLVRRYDWATLVWVLVFAARYLVQNYLYDTDQVGWLAAVRLLMGYPVWILAIAASVWIVVGGHPVEIVRSGLAARKNVKAGSAAKDQPAQP
ncbi:MAG: DUF3159 domain-containing protein [Nakamurella sp.]